MFIFLVLMLIKYFSFFIISSDKKSTGWLLVGGYNTLAISEEINIRLLPFHWKDKEAVNDKKTVFLVEIQIPFA